MFPFHDGCMSEWNYVNCQSVRNHWKEYTSPFLFDTCLVSSDSTSFRNSSAHRTGTSDNRRQGRNGTLY